MSDNTGSLFLASAGAGKTGQPDVSGMACHIRNLMGHIAGIGSFVIYRKNRSIEADDGFYRLFGFDPSSDRSLPVDRCMERIHPADREEVARWGKGITGSGLQEEKEFRIISSDGEFRYIKCLSELSSGEDGDVFAGILVDFTTEWLARKYARLEIDLSVILNEKQSLSEILKYTTEASLSMSGLEVGGVYLVNPLTRDLDLAWQTGVDPRVLAHAVHIKADSPHAAIVFREKPVFSTHRQVLDEMGLSGLETPLKALCVLPITHRGEVIGCMNLASTLLDEVPAGVRSTLVSLASRLGQNIAEANALASLREREENLNLIFELSPDLLMIIDYDGKIVRINKTGMSQLGYHVQDIIGESVLMLYPSQYAREAAGMLKKMNNEEITEARIPLITKSGRWVKVETRISKIFWEHRPAFFTTSRDITAKLETEEMIRATADLFYSLGSDPLKNMEAVVKRTCQILGGVAALYTRFDDKTQQLVVWSGYDLPVGMPLSCTPAGSICFEAAICGDNNPIILENLEHTVFYKTDPHVKKYGFKAYLGHPVALKGLKVGALAVVYDVPRSFNYEEINTIITLTRAISLEEERLAAIRALTESEQLYRSVIEQMTDLFYRTDMEGKILITSPSAYRIIGYNPTEDLIGRNITDIWKHPELRRKMIDKIREDGLVTDYLVTLIKKDGSESTVSVSSHFYYDEAGNEIGIEGLIRDISERIRQEKILRENEERFRNIAENTSDGILIFNENNIIEYASPTYSKMTGFSAEEKVGQAPDEYFGEIHPDDRDEIRQTIRNAIAGMQGDQVYIYRSKHKNGSYFFREDHVRITYDANGKLLKAYASCRDITDRHKAHLELLEAKEKAVESDRLKSSFLANISHEIRTPLNGILGFAEILKTPGLGEAEKQECIDIIDSSSSQLLAIITDIVEISKIETGQAQISVSVFPVIDILNMVYNNFKKHNNTGSSVSFVLNTNGIVTSQQVKTDLTRLQQILSNLTDNALKFTAYGSVELGAELVTGRKIRFYVKDTGPGIKAADQPVIFERFRQLDQSLSRTKGGTGLGLTICKAYAEMLGSSIELQSAPGAGSVFSITLPAGDSAEKEIPPALDEKKQDPKYPNLKGKKVLVADDEDANILYLQILLARCGAEVLKAHDGGEALKMLELHPETELILMDLKMPGISGLEAVIEIRKSNSVIPIVAQTASAMSGEKEEAIEAGCTDYITKPIREADLMKTISRFFQ